MTDTPIAERLAAELGMPWPLRQSWHIDGVLFESPELALGSAIGDGGSPNGCGPAPTGPHPPHPHPKGTDVADPNCPTCRGSGTKSKAEKGTKENGEEYVWWRQVPCGC